MITKRLRPAFYACVLSSLLAFLPVEAQAENNAQYTIQEISDIINSQDEVDVIKLNDGSAIVNYSKRNIVLDLGIIDNKILFYRNYKNTELSNSELDNLNSQLFGKLVESKKGGYIYFYPLPNNKTIIDQDYLIKSLSLAVVDLYQLKNMKYN